MSKHKRPHKGQRRATSHQTRFTQATSRSALKRIARSRMRSLDRGDSNWYATSDWSQPITSNPAWHRAYLREMDHVGYLRDLKTRARRSR